MNYKEKLAKERQIELGKARKGLKYKDENSKFQKKNFQNKVSEISKGTSVGIIAPKVKIGHATLSKAKKIKQVAETEPIIAQKWDDQLKYIIDSLEGDNI